MVAYDSPTTRQHHPTIFTQCSLCHEMHAVDSVTCTIATTIISTTIITITDGGKDVNGAASSAAITAVKSELDYAQKKKMHAGQ